jgi:hypothetical protein
MTKKLTLTKEVLGEIIRRRKLSGKTLSIEKITDEQYSHYYIKDKAKEYYGSWTKALVANGAKVNERYGITKEDVITELKVLQNEGHSMKISEMENWLRYGIKRYFGGYKQAKEELGITVEKHVPDFKSSEARKRANEAKVVWTREKILAEFSGALGKCKTRGELRIKYNTLVSSIHRQYGSLEKFAEKEGFILPDKTKNIKYTKEFISSEILRLDSEGINISSYYLKANGYSGMVSAASQYYGTWNKALVANGIKPKAKIRTKEEVMAEYLSDKNAGKLRSKLPYWNAVKRHFGSFDELEKQLGIYEEPHNYEVYERNKLDEKVFDVLTKEKDVISSNILDTHDKNIVYSIRNYFTSVQDYFNELDIDYYAKPRVPFKWTPENTKRQLMRWIREGYPVNYTYTASKHTGIIEASRRFYGGWEGLFTACGLNYEDYRIDTTQASFYGSKFEDLLAEYFAEMNLLFRREPEINGCHPDFVVGNNWVDAKLSEWTINLADCGTVKKYEPHCDMLMIVYLRGNQDVDKKIGTKTRLVSFANLVKRLPEHKREYFYNRINEINEKLEGVA